eukprot:751313-Hanusia_phi.AAC.4
MFLCDLQAHCGARGRGKRLMLSSFGRMGVENKRPDACVRAKGLRGCTRGRIEAVGYGFERIREQAFQLVLWDQNPRKTLPSQVSKRDSGMFAKKVLQYGMLQAEYKELHSNNQVNQSYSGNDYPRSTFQIGTRRIQKKTPGRRVGEKMKEEEGRQYSKCTMTKLICAFIVT